MSGHLTIVSCGLGPGQLPAQHLQAITDAQVLAGGRRLLDWFPGSAAQCVEIGAHALETAAELAALATEKNVVVLASGDALFFGIARLFSRHLPPSQVTILPNITAAQAALSKLQMPWHLTRFFSVHGRGKPLPWRRVLQAHSAVVYCDSRRTPASVAEALIAGDPSSATRSAAIAAHLGSEQETLSEGSLAELAVQKISGMSMLILKSTDSSGNLPPLPLGLDDDAYAHQNRLITHAEVRAVALAKLKLHRGTLWDLGAGSGSVSVEAASLCEGLSVFAVERSAERCEDIRANATRHGCEDYTVVQGDAADAISDLPAPDFVFIGGGGKDLSSIATSAFEGLRPGGTLVITAVMEETRAALLSLLPEHRFDLVEMTVRRAGPLGCGTLLRPHNPVAIYTFRKGLHS